MNLHGEPSFSWRTLHPGFRVDVEWLGGAIAQGEMIFDQAAPDHAPVDLCALLDARFVSAVTGTAHPPDKPVKRKSAEGTAARFAMERLSPSATWSAGR
jgi:hypothetical protein